MFTFSQGSSRLATLGFGAESLWDSLEFRNVHAPRRGSNSQARTPAQRSAGVPACGITVRPRPVFQTYIAIGPAPVYFSAGIGADQRTRADKNVRAPITPLTTRETHEYGNA